MSHLFNRLLLCTDMDRTVIPNGMQTEAHDARQNFSKFCQQPHIRLSYVTGRHLDLMLEAIEEYYLPLPEFAITDVGTRIYQFKLGQWLALEGWKDELNSAWHDVDVDKIIHQLTGIDFLSLQETEKQNSHKISFYVDLQKTNEKACLQQVTQSLKSFNIESNLIWSIDETTQTGLLDILPSNADKLHAIKFLQKYLKLNSHEVVFAGDSGNDLPVLQSSVQAILVANATPELKQQAYSQAVRMDNQDFFFQAKNTSKNDYSGNYSAGILQGVFHYRPDLNVEA